MYPVDDSEHLLHNQTGQGGFAPTAVHFHSGIVSASPRNQPSPEYPMNSVPEISRWQEGRVDRTKEHFELRYGSAKDGGWSNWLPVALVGPPAAGIVNVQFLVETGDPRNGNAVSDVKREIQYYLFELKGPNPWLYAEYHCGTTSNVIGNVHWSFLDAGKSV